MVQGNSVEKVEFDSYPTRVDNDPRRDFFFWLRFGFVSRREEGPVDSPKSTNSKWCVEFHQSSLDLKSLKPES